MSFALPSLGPSADPISISSYKSYYKQVFIGTILIYIIFLIFIGLGCGLAVSVVNSNQDQWRAVLFFVVIAAIVISIGSYVLTFSL